MDGWFKYNQMKHWIWEETIFKEKENFFNEFRLNKNYHRRKEYLYNKGIYRIAQLFKVIGFDSWNLC